ncbi:MAG: FixH family protein [Chloroflexi bacterium]|nr:FixH family protein [Chloroflexota bacterium]
MKRIGVVMSVLIFAGWLLVACGVPTATPTAAPIANELAIELTTDPDPPKAGDLEIIVTVKDSTGKPVEGAEVRVSANMTAMDMGRMTGKATDQGGGRYALKAQLAHGGEWKFTVQVDKPGLPQGIKEEKLDVK